MNLSSGYPYWLIKDGLPFQYPRLESDLDTNVLIMGGGITGALMGYHLAKAGIECTIVDGRTIGMGSTCASTSLLQYEIDVPLVELKDKIGIDDAVRAYKLCEESIAMLGNIAVAINFTDFNYKKSLYYAASKKDVAMLKSEFDIRQQHGFDVRWLDAAAIQQEFGFDAPGAILSGVAAQTNAYAFAHALHQYSKSNGVKIFDRTAIKNIKHKESGVQVTTEDGFIIKANKLIYANGYEAVNYIDKKIVKLHSTYATASEHSNRDKQFWNDNVLIWNTDDPYLYMRTSYDGRIIIGGRDEKFYDPEKRDELLPGKVKKLAKDFNKLFPSIPFKPEFSWAGTFGITKDGLPFIGNYKKLPNSLFALGFGGNGITFSLIAAEILTDIISGKENKDARIFSFERL
jgi:glycine/D-amino acid oxidase-like deaminating enzyme